MLRSEAFADIGALIQQGVGIIIERWCRRAIEEQPDAKRCHHAVLRDGLPALLRDLGRSLATSQADDDCDHRHRAAAHGEQRWQTGWSLTEVVQDYQILRLVLLEYLDEEVDRPLSAREHMAIGLALDEAVAASVGMYVAHRDESTRQTAREKSEIEQRAGTALRRWQRIFENAGWGVALIDAESGQLTTFNDAFAAMHGYTMAALDGRPFLELVEPSCRDEVAQMLDHPPAERFWFESRQVRSDGGSFPVLVDLSIMRADAENGRCYTAHFADITERKLIEESLREKTQMLEEADRRKDRFLATLAHELRNPLSPIQNAIDLMRRSDDPASLANVIDITERQVSQLVRLVDDLLDVARISQGKVELRKQLVRLEEVVSAAIEASRPAAAARSHQLQVRLPKAPVFLEVDPARLQQVLTNLINNATKYTDPGGEIVVEATSEESQAIICVRDNGIGIAPSLLPRIFELFTQSDVSSRRSQGGLGIGLTLVRSLVELHGGTVAVHSDGLGKGSQFIVRLPVAQTTAEKKKMSSDPAAANGQVRGRILLVDDNKDVVSMLAVLLRRVGHEVITAHDGEEAIDVACREIPQFILLDIGLPGMDGYEVAKRLRTTPQLADSCLIAMTGYGQDEDLRRAEDAGFHHHLLKPVRLESIQGALDAWHKKAVDGK